jgi:hypothetical protein
MKDDKPKRNLVDEASDAYIDWREESAGVWDAYDRWATAPATDAAGAFSAYRAALEREECASRAYAGLLARIAPRSGPAGGLFAPRVATVHR